MMKIKLGADAVLVLVAVGVVGVIVWKAKDVLPKVANAINPLNHDNVFATGVNSAGADIVTEPDGNGKNADGSWSLGGWWADVTSGSNDKIKAMTQGGSSGGATGSW